jgi:hypothetical protein
MWYLLLLASSAPASAVCDNLSQNFVSNEKVWAILHDTRHDVAKASDAAAAVTKATIDIRRAAREWEELKKLDREYAEEGDRIITLMVAHKCTPPDHVASALTYSKYRLSDTGPT